MSRDLPPDSPPSRSSRRPWTAASQGRDVLRHPWALPGGNGRTWWPKRSGRSPPGGRGMV